MPENTLILKRNPNAEYSESYNVLFEGRHVGRIYKAVSHTPRDAGSWRLARNSFAWHRKTNNGLRKQMIFRSAT